MDCVDLSSPELIEEMIQEEIVPKVCVQSALVMRCVSKTWRSMIDSKAFVDKHLVQSSTRRSSSSSRVIFNHISSCVPLSFFPSHQPSIAPFPLNLNLNLHHPDEAARFYVAGHYNGLLCILKFQQHQECFLLLNPATRVSIQLPDIDLVVSKSKLGFGWDKYSGAYKVFVGVPDHKFYYDDGDDHDGRIARIYSSETKSWRAVEHGSDSLITKVGVFASASGKIYWLTRSGHIEYLELRSEVFGKTMIDQPCRIGDGVCLWLWGRMGRLCMVEDTNNHSKRGVWMMKEENNWVEDEGLVCELGMNVHGVRGAFSYFETLLSPSSSSQF